MPTRKSTRRGANGRKRVAPKKSTSRKSTARKRTRRPVLATIRDWLRGSLGRQADDVWGVVLIVFAILVVLGFAGQAGPVGRGIEAGTRYLFGVWRFAFPVALVGIGWALIAGKPRDGAGRLVMGSLATFIGTISLFHLLTGSVSLASDLALVQERGGVVGALLAFPLSRVLGVWGAFVVLAAGVGMGVLVLTRTSVREFVSGLADLGRQLRGFVREIGRSRSEPAARPGRHAARRPRPKVEQAEPPRPAPEVVEPEPSPEPAKKKAKPAPAMKASATPSGYRLPPLDLLRLGGGVDHNKRLLEETARELEDTLHQHGVEATLTKIVPGPTVTRYEIELAPGVKVNKVSNLSHDIAYALATPDVRLLVPIPGKSAIGVEVPNRQRRMVTLGDILRSSEAAGETHPLAVGLGMDISGRAKLLNLSELPHVLIAGATGAGKSSCINSIVTSLLMRTTPDDVRLIMVDPKRVELGQYNGVPHLLTRVITNPKKAADALKWAVAEMDRRYDLLADAKVRDIIGYREKWDRGELDPEGFDRFPYVVVIVDELNDLMMVAGREVEEAIVRIAQMARAVGIHLVIATQRPSVDVITGVIKANVPSRLAFSVASQTDSRVIIDGAGAEKLIGMGDMLVITAKEPRPQRIQGAWVSEEEVHAVVDWVKEQREAEYRDKEVLQAAAEAAAAKAAEEEDEDEELIRRAMEEIVRSQLGSTSMLQRKLRIGFARAGRIMDILENRGVVGPSVGSKARDVLMTETELEELLAGESVEA
ncbi:MAG TPA: DNA translocase FtsK 4TM domain-containing protein [Acidimicrobiia bacterium]|nr:DNA translocase FtsK 4TM domain-containing protein [Acidimicrobiia bacterium]